MRITFYKLKIHRKVPMVRKSHFLGNLTYAECFRMGIERIKRGEAFFFYFRLAVPREWLR